MRLAHCAAALLVTAVAACSDSSTQPTATGTAATANAKPFLPGEQQPVAIAGNPTLAIYPVGSGQILSQTFTPQNNEFLGYLEIPVGCSAGVLLNVKIREGLNGPVLYEMNVAGLPEVVDGSFQLLQVYNPAVTHNGIKLHKGHEYAFELAAFPGPASTGISCGLATGPVGNSYGGGRGYYQDPINGPSFLPLPNGSPADDNDLPFITLVR